MAIDQFSRFKNTELVILDGHETYARWRMPRFLRERPNDEDIKTFRVTTINEGRPDLIATAIYGTPLLDWILIAFNQARGALNWPRTGDIIEYPIEEIVLPELL